MSDKFYVGRDLTGFEDNGKTRPVSRVTLAIDDDNVITAGDDSGYEITATCPHATQEMAEAILAKLKGYRYQMYTAEAANIDPAAELGDAVTADGVYGVISRLSDDGGGYPDITAPGETELEDEYPIEGPMTRRFKKSLAKTNSRISKQSDEINLKIEELGKQSSEALEQKYSEIDQKIDSIKLSVVNGEGQSTLSLKAGETELSSATIVFSGFVTFTDLSTSGKTTISGGNLTTDIIQDQKKKNNWNLNTGELVTNGMTANSITANGTFRCGTDSLYIYLQNGKMEGYRNDSRVGFIDYTAAMEDYDIGRARYGIQMQADGVVRISSPKISVSDTSDIGVTTTHGYTGGAYGTIETYKNGNKIGQAFGLRFVNGLCVGLIKPNTFYDWTAEA